MAGVLFNKDVAVRYQLEISSIVTLKDICLSGQ
jgi:hypothetical protein